MSGHSKWHSIKHKKALIDSKRGKVFTRVIKEITVAARLGGSDPDANPRLRTAIQAAKDVNMPKDTMDRAIKKGAGELAGVAYEEITYEGYGPGGVAVMVKVTTSNKNRTASEVRHAFTKYGGNMGAAGCVSYLFSKQGTIEIEGAEEDAVMEAALEAGADDVVNEGEGYFVVKAHPDSVQDIREAIEKKGIKVISSGSSMVPATWVKLEGKDAEACQKMFDTMEETDDVDDVSSNLETAEVAEE